MRRPGRTWRLAVAPVLSIILLAGSPACGPTTESAEPTQGWMPALVPAPADELAADLVVARAAWSPSHGELLVLPEWRPSAGVLFEPRLAPPYNQLWPVFEALNAQSSAVPELSGGIDGITMLTREEAARLEGLMVGSPTFTEAFPKAGATLQLSRTAFSPDGTLALAFAGYSCGGLCGNGSYYELAHTADGWLVIKTIVIWWS